MSLPTDALLPLELSGRHDETVARFESSKELLHDETYWRGIADWFLLLDRAAELVELHEAYYDQADWLDRYPAPEGLTGAAAHTRLAVALRAVGRIDEADAVVARALAFIEEQRQNGADNLLFWFNDAELAAMTGDRARMLRSIRNAIDTGYLDILGCATLAFEAFRGDPRFIELETEMIRRAKQERQELGLLGN